MNVIIEKINIKAKETYTGEFNDLWIHHWFDIAEKIHDDFVKDDLEQSAKFTRDLINETRDALTKGKKNAIRF